MVKKSKKSKSKRVSLKQKYKVIRKVKEHHKKKAKEAKKLGLNKRKKVEKDPGIPNDWPFKEQELKALEARRARAIEELEQKKAAKKERSKKRKMGLPEDDVANLASIEAEKEHDFPIKRITEGATTTSRNQDHSERAFYKELVKVVEASDVIVEVLDARDPLGTRSSDLEKMVLKADPNKRVILLLNKIDLVPKEAVEKWLKYLRQEFPAVAFKCSTQEQRSNLGRKPSKATKLSNIPQTSDCLGADNLIKLLKNYSRSHEIKLSITVGIVGLPNVGKSSLINSLKRSHVANVGATPGLTRSMQEIQLDKHVKLLDCPGVVMLKSNDNDSSVALRNCKRIEKLDDPVTPVKEILKLCPAERLMSLYKMPSFDSVDDFLQKLATIRGRLKKGGIVDTDAVARIVLHDWNEGKIPYYTLPPKREHAEHMETVIVSEFGKEFDVDEVYKNENSFIESLRSVDDFRDMEVPPGSPVKFDENMLEEDNLNQNEVSASGQVTMAFDDGKDPKEAKLDKSNGQNDRLYTAEGILDPRKRRAEKKKRKEKKRNSMNDMDADYDFKVDYHMRDLPSEDETGDGASDGECKTNEEAPMDGVELD